MQHSPCGNCCADEELRTVGVGASVGHGQSAGLHVSQVKVLVGKLVPID